MVSSNLVDYGTGLIASKFRNQDINSYRSIRGIFKKIAMWLLVVVGAIVDEMIKYSTAQIGIDIKVQFLIASIVAIWITCNEVISILENIQDIGVPIPGFLKPLVKNISSFSRRIFWKMMRRKNKWQKQAQFLKKQKATLEQKKTQQTAIM